MYQWEECGGLAGCMAVVLVERTPSQGKMSREELCQDHCSMSGPIIIRPRLGCLLTKYCAVVGCITLIVLLEVTPRHVC